MAGISASTAGNVSGNVLEVKALGKRYGETRALQDVGFSMREGEILAYLGPNGAGKTTTVSILSGLLERDSGEVSICGFDVGRDPVAVKQRIGVVPEESNLYPELTCRRNLEYLGQLYGLKRSERRRRVPELLEQFDLTEKAAAPFRALSRGMKRRLTVAAALVHSPRVLFLDEPTGGLDVPSARSLRETIRDLNRGGASVLLTTHNLAEAEALAHRIIILVKGRIVACGGSGEIKKEAERVKVLSLRFSGEVGEQALRAACPAVTAVSFEEGAWRLEAGSIHAAVFQIVGFAERTGVEIVEVATSGPSLEDAFVRLLNEGEMPYAEEGGGG